MTYDDSLLQGLPPFYPSPPGVECSLEEVDAHLALHFPHLAPEVRRKLYDSRTERLDLLQVIPFIRTRRHQGVFDTLSSLLGDHPSFADYQFGQDRTLHPGLFITGPCGSGKSALLLDFVRQTSRESKADQPSTVLPAISVTSSSSPTPSLLFSDILNGLWRPHSSKATLAAKELLVYKTLLYFRTRMLIVDHFDSLAATLPDSRALELLFETANFLRLALVFCGTPDSLQRFRHFAPGYAVSFAVQELGSAALDDEYSSFLAAIERYLPLPSPSSLASPDMASLLHSLSGPSIGMTVAIIRTASELAISRDLTNITPPVLHEAASRFARNLCSLEPPP